MNRSVSAVSTGGKDQDGAYKSDGTINTVYIHNCRYLSNVNNKKFIAERKNQGVKVGDGKWSKTGNDLDKIKEFKKQKSKFKWKIKALKKNITNDNDGGYNNYKPEDAGDQFGGKKSNKK